MKVIISDEVKYSITDIFNYCFNISYHYATKVVDNFNHVFRERICKKYKIIYYVSKNNNVIYVQYIFSTKQNSNLFFKIHKENFIIFLNHIKLISN